MTAEDWARITDQLNAILEQPETEAEVLAREPSNIRAELTRLLQAHRAADRDATAAVAAPSHVLAGRYELIELLGAGGSGAAWLSRDLTNDQRVVIKLPLHWEWFRQDLTRRFHSEAQILRGLKHPGIVSMLDSGTTPEGSPFLVMPYIEGQSLRALLDQGPLNHEAAATMVEQLGEAIHCAHQSNVIHRDIKPENIMIQRDPDGGTQRAVLIDFGISLFSDFKEESGTTTRFFGTTRYMAPEQLLGKPQLSSDVYALALIAYEMWTGKPLFTGETPVALYEEQRQLSESRLSAGGLDVPASLRDALWAGLQANPAKRPPVAKFAPAVAQEMRHPGRFSLPSRRTVLASVAVLVPGAAWLGYRNRPLTVAERTVIYKAGQTFELVGWKQAAKVDLDVTVGSDDGVHILGNRLVSSDQGAYYAALNPRVRRQGLSRRWRLTGDLMPLHGYSGFSLCFREAGMRFAVLTERPDNGPSAISAIEAYLPESKKMTTPFDFAPNRVYRMEVTFDPATRAARIAVDGKVLLEGYKGTREYLEIPGISVGFGRNRSAIGEAVIGDITFVMD